VDSELTAAPARAATALVAASVAEAEPFTATGEVMTTLTTTARAVLLTANPLLRTSTAVAAVVSTLLLPSFAAAAWTVAALEPGSVTVACIVAVLRFVPLGCGTRTTADALSCMNSASCADRDVTSCAVKLVDRPDRVTLHTSCVAATLNTGCGPPVAVISVPTAGGADAAVTTDVMAARIEANVL